MYRTPIGTLLLQFYGSSTALLNHQHLTGMSLKMLDLGAELPLFGRETMDVLHPSDLCWNLAPVRILLKVELTLVPCIFSNVADIGQLFAATRSAWLS